MPGFSSGGVGGTDNTTLYVGVGVLVLIIIAALAFVMVRRKK